MFSAFRGSKDFFVDVVEQMSQCTQLASQTGHWFLLVCLPTWHNGTAGACPKWNELSCYMEDSGGTWSTTQKDT